MSLHGCGRNVVIIAPLSLPDAAVALVLLFPALSLIDLNLGFTTF